MQKIFIEDSWKSVLAANGMKTFEDFYHNENKTCINRNQKRNVSRIKLNTDAGEKTFYLKRFRNSHFKDTLFTFLNTGKFMSQAGYEWSNMKLLEKNNIGVPNCICYGEDVPFGLERQSFMITLELNKQCFTDFVNQNWASLPQDEKEKIIIALAGTLSKIHKIGIGLTDLYVWHIYISKTEKGDYDFAFIDLNRMKRNCYGQSERMKNLGRLLFSMQENYFDKSLRRLLIETYAEEMKFKDIEALIRRVKRFSKKYKARKKFPPY
ncbi:MAG: lipopolysaccharide kinase InaA family protein [Phycisphaerales bacterium]